MLLYSMPEAKHLIITVYNYESKLSMLLWTVCPVYFCIISRSTFSFHLIYLKIYN